MCLITEGRLLMVNVTVTPSASFITAANHCEEMMIRTRSGIATSDECLLKSMAVTCGDDVRCGRVPNHSEHRRSENTI